MQTSMNTPSMPIAEVPHAPHWSEHSSPSGNPSFPVNGLSSNLIHTRLEHMISRGKWGIVAPIEGGNHVDL